MNSRALITMMALAIVLAALTGCSDNSNELQNVVCEVESINEGDPLISAAINAGGDGIAGNDDDFVPIDFVLVIFRARAGNTNVTIPDDGTYSSFIITSYDLLWTATDINAPATLTDFNITDGLIYAKVPIGDEAEVSVLVAPAEMKQEAWFQALINPSTPSFSASAQLIFKGHVSGTDHQVEVPAGLMVNFIGTVVN